MYFCPFLDIWAHTSSSLGSGMLLYTLYRLLGWIGTDGVNWDRWGELRHPISRLSLSLRWLTSNFPNNPICPYSPRPSRSTPVGSWQKWNTVRRGGSGQWRWIGTRVLSRERHLDHMSLPAQARRPNSPPLSRSTRTGNARNQKGKRPVFLHLMI